MVSKGDGERIAVGTDIWHCDPNAIICQHGDHLLAFYDSGYRADLTRMNGHLFAKCVQCEPPCYFLGVFATLPSPMVTCYRLSEASYREWDRSNDPTPPTSELLYRLRDPHGRSYNPNFRPANTRRTG